ncbi:MAG: hypothetical protein ABDK87_02300 [Atribacterota bacterium]
MTLRSSGAFAVSLALLGFLVWYFFVFPRPVPLEEVPQKMPQKVGVLLVGAEVMKVTEQGKEWVLKAPRIEKQGDTVTLFSVAGSFLRNGIPFYEVQAEAGIVFLETSTVILENVVLYSVKVGERLSGKRLTWQGKDQEFLMEGVSFSGREFSARCDVLVYNVAERRAHFRGDVVVKLEMGKQ